METNYLNQIFKAFPQPSIIIDTREADYKIVEVSNKFLSLIDAELNDIIGRRIDDIIEFSETNSKNISSFIEQIINIPKDEKLFAQNLQIIPTKEQTNLFNVEFIPLFDGQRQIDYIQIILDNAYEREHLKKNIDKLQLGEEIAKLGYWQLDLRSNKIKASDGALKIYGYSKNEIYLNEIMATRLPECKAYMDKALADLIHHNTPYDVEFKIKRVSDGEIRDIHSKADIDKESGIVMGIIQDITEQKKIENEILKSDIKWKTILEVSPVPMAINNGKQEITFLNQAFIKLLGYTLKDIPNLKKWWLKAYPDKKYRHVAKKTWIKKVESSLLNGTELTPVEYEITCKNGEKKTVLISAKPLGESHDNQHLVILYDITVRKKEEQTQLESLQIIEGIMNSINVRVFWKDKNLKYLGCNKNFAIDAGFANPEDLIGKDDYEMIWHHQADLYRNDDLQVIESDCPKLNIEEPQTSPSGQMITLLTNKIPLKNASGEIYGVLGTYFDITERKESEEQLLKNKIYLQTILQSTNDGILAVDLEGKIIFHNSRFIELWNIPQVLIHEKNNEKLRHYVVNQLLNPEFFEEKVNLLYKSDEMSFDSIDFKDGRTFERLSQPLQLNGKSHGRVWSFRDVTERKRIEEKIRAKDIEFRKLSNHVPDLIFQFTRRPDGSYYVPIASLGIRNIFGCEPEEVSDNFEAIARVLHPEDTERVIEDIEYSAKNLSLFSCEFRVQIPGKDIQWIYSKSSPEKLPDGSVTWYGFNVNITQRKKAEEKLLELSRAVEQSPATIVITDKDGNIQYVNPMFTHTTGYTFEEVLGKNPRILKSGETSQDEYKYLWKSISSGREWFGELHNKKKNGDLYWESAHISPIIDKHGQIISYLAVKTDVTIQKQIREELIKSNQRYNLVAMATNDSIWDLNLITEEISRTGDGFKNLFGYKTDEQKKMKWKNLVHPDDLADLLESQNFVFSNRNTFLWEFEYRFLKANGEYAFVHDKAYIVRNEKGKAIRLIGATRDISERVAHIKSIEEQNKKLRDIAWKQSHIVRAPVARIMGLINLLSDEKTLNDETNSLLKYIEESALELDSIIKSIVENTITESDGNYKQ